VGDRGGSEGGEKGTFGGADSARATTSGERHVADICREQGISEATFYIWKKKYSGLGLSELRELRQLREENGKLKRLVADLSLDRHILQEIVQKKL
jgi:putative transposase